MKADCDDVSVATGEGGARGDIGEGAGVPGEQTDEEDRETGEGHAHQAEHPGTGNHHAMCKHYFMLQLGKKQTVLC